ncbi:MAG TPA: sulfate ABC transporter substrate-binding protein [Cyanophyceae cyanobacterium]
MPYRQPQKHPLWMNWITAIAPQLLALWKARSWRFLPLRRHTVVLLFVTSCSLCLFISACVQNTASVTTSPASQAELITQRHKPIELSVVSFAVTRAAYAEIIPLFQEKWQREHQQQVRFRHSFAGSSTQTRAVINGLPTDVVHLALVPDVTKIEQAGLIQPGWETRVPNHGIVTRTVGAIVTRSGNPKKIQTWSDLAKPEVSVITADPKTSGIARWNFLAFWGSVTQTGGTEGQALDFVTKVYRNAHVLAKDAREATDMFLRQHKGDVLINYENELILAAQEGLAKDAVVIIPNVNISIDNAIAIVDKYADRRGTREVAEAFVQFLFTPEAQRAFAKVGFRPINPVVAQEFSSKFPPVSQLLTVEVFGGWNTIQEKFFRDGGLFDQIQASLRPKVS